MSEISITRFQPAPVTREKVNSVAATENDVGYEHSQSALQEKQHGDQQEKQQGGKEQNQQPKPGRAQTSTEREGRDAAAKASGRGKVSNTPVDDDVMQDALEKAVTRLNDYVQHVKRDLIFDIDPESQEPSVTVVDRESRQVLRHFDSHEALELAKKLDAEEPISLFKTKV